MWTRCLKTVFLVEINEWMLLHASVNITVFELIIFIETRQGVQSNINNNVEYGCNGTVWIMITSSHFRGTIAVLGTVCVVYGGRRTWGEEWVLSWRERWRPLIWRHNFCKRIITDVEGRESNELTASRRDLGPQQERWHTACVETCRCLINNIGCDYCLGCLSWGLLCLPLQHPEETYWQYCKPELDLDWGEEQSGRRDTIQLDLDKKPRLSRAPREVTCSNQRSQCQSTAWTEGAGAGIFFTCVAYVLDN